MIAGSGRGRNGNGRTAVDGAAATGCAAARGRSAGADRIGAGDGGEVGYERCARARGECITGRSTDRGSILGPVHKIVARAGRGGHHDGGATSGRSAAGGCAGA